MTQIALRGKVTNLTGFALAIVNETGSSVIRQYKKEGCAVAETQEELLGYLNSKVELGYSRVVGIRGLPEVREGQYYIVSHKVARAAMLLGRTLGDLMVPDLPVYYNEGNARGIKGYRRLAPALYHCQSL